MAQQTINIGAAPNDGTGDTLRDAMDKCNDNFTELYAGAGTPTAITVANEAADTTCFPLFVTAATGDLGPKTNAGLAFDSSTGMLTATGFTGPLTGTADAANALKSATTTVGVSAATAPSSGQVLTATSSTAATWQTPAASSPGGSSGQIQYNSSGSFAGSLLTQGTNTISQINSTNAQTMYLYATDDGGTNYFRSKFATTDGTLTITNQTGGTGSTDGNFVFQPCGHGRFAVDLGLSYSAGTGWGYFDLDYQGDHLIRLTGYLNRANSTLEIKTYDTQVIGPSANDKILIGDLYDGIALPSASNYKLKWGDTYALTYHVAIESPSSGVLEINNGTAGTYRDLKLRNLGVSEANGQQMGVKVLTELTTIAASANTDTAIQFPANCMILGVSCRVTVAITCTSTFDIGVAGNTTKFGTGISKAANTTNTQLIVPEINGGSAVSVRITPDTVPSDATGRLRVTIYYIDLTAATS